MVQDIEYIHTEIDSLALAGDGKAFTQAGVQLVEAGAENDIPSGIPETRLPGSRIQRRRRGEGRGIEPVAWSSLARGKLRTDAIYHVRPVVGCEGTGRRIGRR